MEDFFEEAIKLILKEKGLLSQELESKIAQSFTDIRTFYILHPNGRPKDLTKIIESNLIELTTILKKNINQKRGEKKMSAWEANMEKRFKTIEAKVDKIVAKIAEFFISYTFKDEYGIEINKRTYPLKIDL